MAIMTSLLCMLTHFMGPPRRLVPNSQIFGFVFHIKIQHQVLSLWWIGIDNSILDIVILVELPLKLGQARHKCFLDCLRICFSKSKSSFWCQLRQTASRNVFKTCIYYAVVTAQ